MTIEEKLALLEETLEMEEGSLSADMDLDDVDEYVSELQEGEVMLVQPMLTAKIYDGETGE